MTGRAGRGDPLPGGVNHPNRLDPSAQHESRLPSQMRLSERSSPDSAMGRTPHRGRWPAPAGRKRSEAVIPDPTRFAMLTDLPDAGHNHPGIREVSPLLFTGGSLEDPPSVRRCTCAATLEDPPLIRRWSCAASGEVARSRGTEGVLAQSDREVSRSMPRTIRGSGFRSPAGDRSGRRTPAPRRAGRRCPVYATRRSARDPRPRRAAPLVGPRS